MHHLIFILKLGECHVFRDDMFLMTRKASLSVEVKKQSFQSMAAQHPLLPVYIHIQQLP